QLACPFGDPRAQLQRLPHDRLTAERENLAHQPVLAADCDLLDRRAVLQQPCRAALEAPACDLRRIPDLNRPGVGQPARLEALTRLEILGEQPRASHPVEPKRALARPGPVPR